MRLFIGIKTGTEKQLSALQSELARAGTGKFVPSENLHLTLKFLGEVNPKRIGSIQQAMDEVSAVPFRLQTLGAHPFGKSGLVVAGVGGDLSQLAALHAQLDNALAKRSFAKDDRPYRPHITLARKYYTGDDTIGDIEALPFEPCPFTVREIILFESKRVDGRLYYVREYGQTLG